MFADVIWVVGYLQCLFFEHSLFALAAVAVLQIGLHTQCCLPQSRMTSVMFRPFMIGMVKYLSIGIWWTLTFWFTHGACVYIGDFEVRGMFDVLGVSMRFSRFLVQFFTCHFETWTDILCGCVCGWMNVCAQEYLKLSDVYKMYGNGCIPAQTAFPNALCLPLAVTSDAPREVWLLHSLFHPWQNLFPCLTTSCFPFQWHLFLVCGFSFYDAVRITHWLPSLETLIFHFFPSLSLTSCLSCCCILCLCYASFMLLYS